MTEVLPALPSGLAKCPPHAPPQPRPRLRTVRPRPHATPASERRRAQADADARDLIRMAFGRTGPTAVATRLGINRTVARGFAGSGLAITLRDVLAAPPGFARDVLEAALLLVADDVPATTAGLDRLASRLLVVTADLCRLAEETGGAPPGDPSDPVRRAILALFDRAEELIRQGRRALLTPSAPAKKGGR